MTTCAAAAAQPTPSEVRVPCSRRARVSRPALSVPSGWSALGGCGSGPSSVASGGGGVGGSRRGGPRGPYPPPPTPAPEPPPAPPPPPLGDKERAAPLP